MDEHPDNDNTDTNPNDNGNAPHSRFRFVLSDFVRGSFILIALSVDVFFVFQLYVWFPNNYVALFVILAVITLGFAEYKLYHTLRRIINRDY